MYVLHLQNCVTILIVMGFSLRSILHNYVFKDFILLWGEQKLYYRYLCVLQLCIWPIWKSPLVYQNLYLTLLSSAQMSSLFWSKCQVASHNEYISKCKLNFSYSTIPQSIKHRHCVTDDHALYQRKMSNSECIISLCKSEKLGYQNKCKIQ